MAGEKTLFVLVEKVTIGKVWDKAMEKPAVDAFLAAVEKGLNSSGSKVVKSIGKDEEGFKISLTLESLDFDEKKDIMALAVKGVIAALPKDKYVGGLDNNGKLSGVNPKNIEADVKALCIDAGGNLADKLKKKVK